MGVRILNAKCKNIFFVAFIQRKKDTFGCPFCVCLGHRCAERSSAHRRCSGIRFAFCEQGDGSSLTRAASKNLRATREYSSAQPTVLTLIDAGRINPDSIRSLGFFIEKFRLKTNRCQWVFSRVVTNSNARTKILGANSAVLLAKIAPNIKEFIVKCLCLKSVFYVI